VIGVRAARCSTPLPLLASLLAGWGGCGADDGGPVEAGADAPEAGSTGGPRVLIESATGQGGDDDASLVRFLLYAHQWRVEGILTPARAAVLRHLDAYRQMLPQLRLFHPDYPEADLLEANTAATDGDGENGVALVLQRLRAPSGPLWYLRWSRPAGGAPGILRRALDRLQAEDSPDRYRRLLSELRVVGDGEALGDHVLQLALLVDTRDAEFPGAFTLTSAAGYEAGRDVLGSGTPLGILYPAEALERSSFTFLYLIDNGLGPPHEPRWSTWAGRFIPDGSGLGSQWVTAAEPTSGVPPGGSTIIAGFAAAIQNDFVARLQSGRAGGGANHAPRPMVKVRKLPTDVSEPMVTGTPQGSEPLFVAVTPGRTVMLDASGSIDPDGHAIKAAWSMDVAASSFSGTVNLSATQGPVITAHAPESFPERQSFHILLAITDNGQPPLTRYRRIILTRPR
jgi:hypothetical protein